MVVLQAWSTLDGPVTASPPVGRLKLMRIDQFTGGMVCRVTALDSPRSNSLCTAPNMHFAIERGVGVASDVAVDLWQQLVRLPQGEQARCHLPRFAIGLSKAGILRWAAAVCWKCNNISLRCDREYTWRAFDSESPQALRLLAEVRSHVEKGADN